VAVDISESALDKLRDRASREAIPGIYTVTVSVTATVTATGKKYPIQESLQVAVK